MKTSTRNQYWVETRCPECESFNWVFVATTYPPEPPDITDSDPEAVRCRNCETPYFIDDPSLCGYTEGTPVSEVSIEDGIENPLYI